MTDPLSALLGLLLTRLVIVGAVVVGMAMALRGEYLLAAAMVAPLGIAGYLLVTDGWLLE